VKNAELPGPNRDWDGQTPDDPDGQLQTDNDFGIEELPLKKIDNCYLKICML